MFWKHPFVVFTWLVSKSLHQTKEPIAHGPCWRSDQSFASERWGGVGNWSQSLGLGVSQSWQKSHKIPSRCLILNQNPLICVCLTTYLCFLKGDLGIWETSADSNQHRCQPPIIPKKKWQMTNIRCLKWGNIYYYIYIPKTQMTLVLIGKGWLNIMHWIHGTVFIYTLPSP